MEPNQNNDKKKPTNGNGPKNSQIIIALVIVGILTLLIMTGMDRFITSRTTQQISYNEFLNKLDNGQVKAVKISGDRLEIALNDEPLMTYYTAYLPDMQACGTFERCRSDILWR